MKKVLDKERWPLKIFLPQKSPRSTTKLFHRFSQHQQCDLNFLLPIGNGKRKMAKLKKENFFLGFLFPLFCFSLLLSALNFN
jgi:hypothetical protein